MDGRRPRGPKTRGLVPQGPEEAAKRGERGEQRLRVMQLIAVCSGDGLHSGECNELWGVDDTV